MKQFDLEIIILNYNTEFWLKKSLQSLEQFYLQNTNRLVQVTVVDNNSTDNSVQMVRHSFPNVQLVSLAANNGFAYGNNRALEKSTAKYLMLLNSDVELTQDSNLDLLLDYLEQYPKVGVITPKVVFTNGSIDPACHRGEPTLWASFTYFMGLETVFPFSSVFAQYHQTYKNLNAIHQVDACSGAAMIVRGSAMKQVGLLDEQFFMYAEDLDWCRRFREAGYQIVFFPQVSLIHHKYKSGIKNTSQKIAHKTKGYFYDTMLQYYDKYYTNRYPAFVRNIIKYLLLIKKGV